MLKPLNAKWNILSIQSTDFWKAIRPLAALLEEKGIKVSVASVISEGLFRQQSKAYQLSVIPDGVPVFGMTAGLSVNMQGLVGPHGKVFGVDHFGYSAPAKVLDEKLGFTGENVLKQVLELLGK